MKEWPHPHFLVPLPHLLFNFLSFHSHGFVYSIFKLPISYTSNAQMDRQGITIPSQAG